MDSVWTEMHESEWEFGKIRTVLTWSAHKSDMINAEPKGYQQAQNFQAPWKSEWFLQAVLPELSGDRSLVLWSDLTPACWDHSQDLGGWELPKAFAYEYDHDWSCIYNEPIVKAVWLNYEMLSLHVIVCLHKNRTFIFGTGMCHGSLFSFSCEAGSSLSVLSELGHLCLAFFLQTTHSGNLFAVFVALLWKWNEASAS